MPEKGHKPYVGIIRCEVGGQSRMDALLNLHIWAERCVQRVPGDGMFSKGYTVSVDGFHLTRGGDFYTDEEEAAEAR